MVLIRESFARLRIRAKWKQDAKIIIEECVHNYKTGDLGSYNVGETGKKGRKKRTQMLIFY